MSKRNLGALVRAPIWIGAVVTGCNITGVPDTLPPAAVVDLRTDAVSTTTVVLRWTAPGNDGSIGAAARYDVRHSPTPITDSSWNSATPVAPTDVPKPAAAGTPQQLTLVGLAPHQAYYFALRASDPAGNQAPISNAAVAATENWGRAESEVELIGQLKNAYKTRNYDAFRRLLHPGYRFYLNEPQPDGTAYWDQTEELRIHFRMFDPQEVTPPATRVPQELWLVSIDVGLTLRGAFQDAPVFYFDAIRNPTGFHREEFSVTQADYTTYLFLHTQGETQYRVDGVANFVVVNDLAKAAGDEGKFLIYGWSDLGSPATFAMEAKTWSMIKSVYR